MFTYFIITVVCLAAFIALWFISRIWLVRGVINQGKHVVHMEVFRKPEEKENIISFTANGIKEVVEDKDLFKSHMYTKGMSKSRNFMRTTGGAPNLQFQTHLLNLRERSIHLFSNKGSTFIHPTTKLDMKPKEAGLTKLSELNSFCFENYLAENGTFEEFIDALLMFTYTNTRVQFIGNRRMLWLSTSTTTKTYLQSMDVKILDLLSSSLTDPEELVVSGSLEDKNIVVRITKQVLFTLILPEELRGMASVKLSNEDVKKLNKFDFSVLESIQQKKMDTGKSIYNWFLHSNQLYMAIKNYKNIRNQLFTKGNLFPQCLNEPDFNNPIKIQMSDLEMIL